MALKDHISKNDTRYTSTIARQVIEDHMEYIRKTSTLAEVSGVLSNKYQTNLYGLYQALNISKSLWWITTRVNRFTYETKLSDLTFIAVPNYNEVEKLIKIINTKELAIF
jgi:hypothetical protein